MKIIKLDPYHMRDASKVLSMSFFDYPMFTFYFPNRKRRARFLPWYFRNILNCAMSYGDVYTTPGITGVCFTLPPGHTELSLREYILNGFLPTPFVMGLRNYKRSMECERFVASAQKRLMEGRPHCYLWGLAVDPGQQAKGIGAALMEPVLRKAGDEKFPVYLETHDERNVSYYQKHNFNLIDTLSIPKYALPFWCMVWEPV